MKGASEKTSSDKLRERQRKKKERRLKRREKDKRQQQVEKLNPGLGNKYSKDKALEKLEKESKMERGGVTLVKVGSDFFWLLKNIYLVCLFLPLTNDIR